MFMNKFSKKTLFLIMTAFLLIPYSVFGAVDDATTFVPNPKFMNGNMLGDTPKSVTPSSPTNSTIYGSDQNKIPNPLGGNTNSLPAFFDSIISVVLELGTIVSVLAIMYGGFLYVTAQGDEEKLGKAYKTITWALVGTAILLGARTIMYAVTDTVKQLGQGIN